MSLTKDDANLVGISIGGGAPLCPHVYIVQVFDNTPAALDQTLESGDRIVAVNNADVMGRTKLEVARMIQNAGVSKFRYACMPKHSVWKLSKMSHIIIASEASNFYLNFRAKNHHFDLHDHFGAKIQI